MRAATTGWEAKRQQMVDSQLRGRDLHDDRVLAAMAAIPRELFVPPAQRKASYSDEPLPIGSGQTISQPFITALMVQELELESTDTVLEVGTGCGYHAAVLASIAARVISVEIVPELAAYAGRNLEAAGFGDRVTIVAGDGSAGCLEYAPYNAISVAAAAPGVPPQLLEQLADGGRLVIPVGSLSEQDLRVIRNTGGKFSTRFVSRCRFVPLRGGQGWGTQ